jgi:transcriptional regulator with XRE-family HTH domain
MNEPDDEPNDVGNAIRRLRGDRVQWKLAEVVGLKPSTWSEYEAGKRKPRGRNFGRVAEALGVDAKTLEQEVLKVIQERLTPEESGTPAPAGAETSDSLIKMIDRRVRAVDHKMDDLLEAKQLLLILRQFLLNLPAGTAVTAER